MISAIVHTYNEEKNIGRCLSSLNFVDEIVLIDMRSTDSTREIARRFKLKIYDHPYTGFVEKARNFGINKAKGPWILIVDADEIVPASLAIEVRKIMVSSDAADFYRIPRKNIIFNKWIKHSLWWPDHQIRLFKKGHVFWSDKIHAIPQTKGKGLDIEPKEELSLIHYHYDSLEQYLDRMNRYTSIQAKEKFIFNEKANLSKLLINPVNEFVKRFFMYEGYKDGFHGLSLSLMQSFSEAVVILKLWELSGFEKEAIRLNEFQKIQTEADRIKKYWLINELLKKSGNIVSSLYLKFLRKLNS